MVRIGPGAVASRAPTEVEDFGKSSLAEISRRANASTGQLNKLEVASKPLSQASSSSSDTPLLSHLSHPYTNLHQPSLYAFNTNSVLGFDQMDFGPTPKMGRSADGSTGSRDRSRESSVMSHGGDGGGGGGGGGKGRTTSGSSNLVNTTIAPAPSTAAPAPPQYATKTIPMKPKPTPKKKATAVPKAATASKRLPSSRPKTSSKVPAKKPIPLTSTSTLNSDEAPPPRKRRRSSIIPPHPAVNSRSGKSLPPPSFASKRPASATASSGTHGRIKPPPVKGAHDSSGASSSEESSSNSGSEEESESAAEDSQPEGYYPVRGVARPGSVLSKGLATGEMDESEDEEGSGSGDSDEEMMGLEERIGKDLRERSGSSAFLNSGGQGVGSGGKGRGAQGAMSFSRMLGTFGLHSGWVILPMMC